MESQYQKWANLSYLAVAVLLGYVLFATGAKLMGAYDLEAHFRNADLILRAVSVIAAAALFFGLYSHEQVNQFVNEVMVELSRVTWPTQKETTSATAIVIVMVVISGIILGALDYFWTILLRWII